MTMPKYEISEIKLRASATRDEQKQIRKSYAGVKQ